MSNIFRSFDLKPDVQGERLLIMVSQIEGEFGPVVINSVLSLDGETMAQTVKESSGTLPEYLYEFRVAEMQYLLNVSHFFKPLTPLSHGIQEPQAPES